MLGLDLVSSVSLTDSSAQGLLSGSGDHQRCWQFVKLCLCTCDPVLEENCIHCPLLGWLACLHSQQDLAGQLGRVFALYGVLLPVGLRSYSQWCA